LPKLLISTVVSADEFQAFIPLFAYSILRAYPDVKVKIFLKGLLDRDVEKFIPENTKVYQEMFWDVPDRVSTCNSLRHLIPIRFLRGFDYMYNTDVDFIVFNHKVSHLRYYTKIMEKTKLPYAGARGPLKGPKRPEICPRWDGKFKRIAAGCLMTSQEFYEITNDVRRKYLKKIINGDKDTCYFREYDEVLFQRICTESGLKTPIKENRFVNDEKMHARFRDIHLGDFKFPTRYKNLNKMKRILLDENVKKFIKLENEGEWRDIVENMSRFKLVDKMMKKLRKHILFRKRSLK